MQRPGTACLNRMTSNLASWLGSFALVALLLVALVRGGAILSGPVPELAVGDATSSDPACFSVERAAADGRDSPANDRGDCTPTSGALLARAAGPALRVAGADAPSQATPARKTGIASFALLMLLAGWGTWLLLRRAGRFHALVLAALAALVLADPVVLRHAYTITGFAPCLFLAATLASLAALGVEQHRAGVLRWIAALALLGFATSLVPHLALGFVVLVLFAAACITAGRRDWPTLLALFAAAAVGFAVVFVFARPEVEAIAQRIAAAKVGGFADLRPLLPPGAGSPDSPSLPGIGAWSWAHVLDQLPLRDFLVFFLAPAALVVACGAFGGFRNREAGAVFAFLALALLPYPMAAALVFGGDAVRPGDAFLVFACVVAFWFVAASAAIAAIARITSDTLTGWGFRALDAARARGRTVPVAQRARTAASSSAVRQSRPQT